MSTTTVLPGGKIGVNFVLQGALEVSRALGASARNLPKIQQRAIATLRRRLPVQARRDIQAEYAIPAGRLNKDLGVGNIAGGLRLTGYFRGIGLRSSAESGRCARAPSWRRCSAAACRSCTERASRG
jgi:hypothetical protein